VIPDRRTCRAIWLMIHFTSIDHTYANDIPEATLTPENPLAGPLGFVRPPIVRSPGRPAPDCHVGCHRRVDRPHIPVWRRRWPDSATRLHSSLIKPTNLSAEAAQPRPEPARHHQTDGVRATHRYRGFVGRCPASTYDCRPEWMNSSVLNCGNGGR
jgi:hypothetical protein